MELKEIREELQRAVALIEEYEQSQLSIERDTALEIIRRAYEALRFGTIVTAVPATPVTPTEAVAPAVKVAPAEVVAVEPTESEVAEEPIVVEPTPEPEVEEDIVVEPTPAPVVEEVIPEPIEEPVIESDPIEEPELIVAPEPMVEPKVQRVVEPSLFGDDDQWSRPVPSRRRIISLYDEDGAEPRSRRRRVVKEVAPAPVVEVAPTPAAEPVAPAEPVVPAPVVEVTPEPIVEPTPAPAPAPTPKVEPVAEVVAEIAEPSTVLADTIEGPKTIADTIASQPSIGESGVVVSLRSAISVGDRFMLIRELFAGDEAKYEQTIDVLDSMDNLDDCIIYIAENFFWRSTSEGAKMIMDLLQRKLG